MPAAATKDAQTMPTIDVVIEADAWAAYGDAEDIVRKAIEAAAAFENKPGEVAVMLTDDATIQQLNAQWRGMEKPTNVLAFPASDVSAAQDHHLGDIAIACETVAREAEAENKAFSDHLAHLAIHGYLHLIGFDHETDDEACRMESLETRILSSLAIADPYTDRKFAD
ncbi:rRNA maturation RNase YbeY [Pseudorhodoplanes sinuspersici]|uniref:Endoribonuclease YbeY n=2 Tax=Pseudorhodoplanes sinuspersici TaxID=1235591 RepID=A0A1W7A0E5_9HYPH|nr:rRNA maturation RNase YbeY [Pseudorhodoplanes sinuspersici]